MPFLRDHDGGALGTAWIGENHASFHSKLSAQTGQPRADCFGLKIGFGPGRLEDHAELASRHLFLEGFDVGFLGEEKAGDPGNNTGFVSSDYVNGSEMFHD